MPICTVFPFTLIFAEVGVTFFLCPDSIFSEIRRLFKASDEEARVKEKLLRKVRIPKLHERAHFFLFLFATGLIESLAIDRSLIEIHITDTLSDVSFLDRVRRQAKRKGATSLPSQQERDTTDWDQ